MGYQVGQEQSDSGLHMRVNPSKFSGPEHLRRLYGKCFEKTDDTYVYRVIRFTRGKKQQLTHNQRHIFMNCSETSIFRKFAMLCILIIVLIAQ